MTQFERISHPKETDMHKLAHNLTGRRFGRLKVISYHGRRKTPNGTLRSQWLCKCNCGNEKIIEASNLHPRKSKNNTVSCGCYRLDQVASKQPFGVEYRRYKKQHLRTCKLRNGKRPTEFKLSLTQFKKLILNNCSYCGSFPSIKMHVGGGLRNSIDRIDCSIGYTQSNCVTACYICNQMKGSLSFDAFISQITTIESFLESQKINQTKRGRSSG